MDSSSSMRRGYYFEEFEIGHIIISPARTVTEADVVAFAGLSGDYNAIHTDAVYASKDTFGQRVAHGLLCMAIVSGLATRTGALEGTVIAFREIMDWKFSRPVFIGDTIHARMEVKSKKTLPRLNGGRVDMHLSVINQDDVEVMKGTWVVLMHSQPS